MVVVDFFILHVDLIVVSTVLLSMGLSDKFYYVMEVSCLIFLKNFIYLNDILSRWSVGGKDKRDYWLLKFACISFQLSESALNLDSILNSVHVKGVIPIRSCQTFCLSLLYFEVPAHSWCGTITKIHRMGNFVILSGN